MGDENVGWVKRAVWFELSAMEGVWYWKNLARVANERRPTEIDEPRWFPISGGSALALCAAESSGSQAAAFV